MFIGINSDKIFGSAVGRCQFLCFYYIREFFSNGVLSFGSAVGGQYSLIAFCLISFQCYGCFVHMLQTGKDRMAGFAKHMGIHCVDCRNFQIICFAPLNQVKGDTCHSISFLEKTGLSSFLNKRRMNVRAEQDSCAESKGKGQSRKTLFQ